MFLVTADEALWPLVGADLSGDLMLKQFDSVDELHATVPSGQAGIVLWDARGEADPAAVLTKLSLHSTRFAVVVLDSDADAGAWTLPMQHRQIVTHVGLPLSSVALGRALEIAREEVGARLALLGDQSGAPAAPTKSAGKHPWLPIGLGAAALLAGAAAFVLLRGGAAPEKTTADQNNAGMAAAPSAAAAGKAPEPNDEKVDTLIERAQQAMLERHFIDPAAGSALSLYRDVLHIDPSNGEARQGLQRLEEILITRVQSALDERKFDLALQSLETARSIDPGDRRLAALDERIASLRAELGPAQIIAAVNAQNFDRAAQLIDDAARSKSLPAVKLAQLRDDLRKRREEAETALMLKSQESVRVQKDLTVARNAVPASKPEQPDLEAALNRPAPGKTPEGEVGSTVPPNAVAAAAAPAGVAPTSSTPTVVTPSAGAPVAAMATTNTPAAAPPNLPEQMLTRLNKLEVVYPPRALERGLEGWVQIGFTVNPDGSVGQVAAVGSAPANTFEQAGIKAVSKLRYQPVMRDGKPVAVTSELRVVFRIPK